MDWDLITQLYLAITRIFDRFIYFLNDVFGEDAE